jgi:hypothetical protein
LTVDLDVGSMEATIKMVFVFGVVSADEQCQRNLLFGFKYLEVGRDRAQARPFAFF